MDRAPIITNIGCLITFIIWLIYTVINLINGVTDKYAIISLGIVIAGILISVLLETLIEIICKGKTYERFS